MSYDKKQIILDKLSKLITLLEEVHEGDENNLFHEDWIEVTDTISKIDRSSEASKETLDRMNIVWRKNQAVKKFKAENNGELPKEDFLDLEVISMLKVNKKIAAIKFIRENKLTTNGALMSLIEAKDYVDQIETKNGL